MNNNENSVKFSTYEGACARLDAANRRQFIIIILLIFALIGTNAAWIYYESQFQIVESTTTQRVVQEADGSGNNSFVGGDVYNGETDDTD